MNRPGEKPLKEVWRFTNALPSWTWAGYEGQTAAVEVYSAAHAVELKLNGKSVGKKKVKHYIASFRVNYAPGELEAIAYDKTGAECGRSALKTGGKPELRVRAEKSVLVANGQDLAYIHIELADENGIISPIDGEELSVEVTGAARLQAFGSAARVSDESWLDHVHTTYQGRCIAILRAGYERGEAQACISGKEYETKSVTINVR